MGNYMPGPPSRQMMTPQVKKKSFFPDDAAGKFFFPFRQMMT